MMNPPGSVQSPSDPVPFVKNAKFGGRDEGASSQASPGSMYVLQERSANAPYYLNFRPPKAQGIPAALIDSIFGNFKDRLQNIDRDQKAYDDVRPLIYSLSHYHEHPLEARLRESVIHCLREIFQAVVKVKGECKGCIEIHSELDKTSDRTNESIDVLIWVQIKPTFTSTRGDPYAEGACHYNDYINKEKWFQTARGDKFYYPALSLEVVSNSIKVNAIYTGGKEVGNRICVEPLSDAVVFLNFLRADCGKMDQLASFTYALRKAFEELQERYTEFHKDEGPPDQTADFPYPLRETRFSEVTWMDSELDYNARKLVFAAKLEEKKVVVKFTPQDYDEDAHVRFSQEGLSPELIECKKLSGGWKMVVMQKLCEEDGWHSLEDAENEYSEHELQKIASAVSSFLDKFHGLQNVRYVHSDFRPVNIFFRYKEESIEVQMIDLDDVGVEGQSEYGGFLSKEIPWPKSVFYGQKKFQDHDRQLLKRTWSSFHRLLNKQSKIQARAFPIPLQRSFLHSRPFKSMFFR